MIQPDPAIDALYAAWIDAFRRRDVDAVLGLLTPDYVLWAAGAPEMRQNELRPRLAAAFAAFAVEPAYECEERLIAGDLAFERGWDIQTVRPLAGGPEQTQRQRVFLVLRRGDDGVWRFARGMSQPGPAA